MKLVLLAAASLASALQPARQGGALRASYGRSLGARHVVYAESPKPGFNSQDGGAISAGGFNTKGEPPVEIRG